MADQPLREIQISVKQLVFVFMASVVLAVAVFLLGVSVGRGVRDRTGGAASLEQAAGPSVPVGPTIDPGPTQIGSDTLKYPELSKPDLAANVKAAGQTADATPPQPAVDAPEVSEPEPAGASKAIAPAPAAAAPPKAGPAAKTEAPKPAPKSAEQPAAPKAGAGWSVQVNAFRSRENAEKQVASLKDKGYPAFLMPAPPGGFFNVRVGPYPQRADADRMRTKLRQEGFNPSVTR